MLPVYPLVQGLGQRRLRALIANRASRGRRSCPNGCRPTCCTAQAGRAGRRRSRAVHRPADAADLEPDCAGPARLACDELLASQLALGLMRAARTRLPGRALAGDGTLIERMTTALPFALTSCQQRAIGEIERDLASPSPMLRLLQGDVGSGKTVVAAAAMLRAIEAGAQAALMAPTEVLARQHAATLARLLAPLGLTVALLTGARAGQLAAGPPWPGSPSGEAAIAVGTHALLEDGVEFRDLGPGRDRRAAPLRRRAAARPRGQGPCRRRAADDRDTDPAQPGARGLWRPRQLAADGQAAGARSRS